MSGWRMKDDVPFTPAPAEPRAERMKALAVALTAEAELHRKDSVMLERFARMQMDRDRLVNAWVSRAKALKRRLMYRSMDRLAGRIAEYVDGEESLGGVILSGRTYRDMVEQESP